MVSKRWQRKQSIIQHTTLFLLWGGILYWLQLDLNAWQKLVLIGATIALSLWGGYYLTRRFARSIVRVFEFNDDTATSIVQRALNTKHIRFSRQNMPDKVHFKIRDQGLTLVIEPYPLNLPIDDHLQIVEASKIEIYGLNQTNLSAAENVCQAINATVADRIG